MVLDTSAVVAILLASRNAIDSSPRGRMSTTLAISAATLVEASIVMQAKHGVDGVAT